MTTAELVDTDHAITADDIKALRQANSWVLFYRPNGEEGCVSGLRIGHEVRLADDDAPVRLARIAKAGLWTRTYTGDHTIDFSRLIPAGIPSQVANYGPMPTKEAVWVRTSSRFDAQLNTIIHLLRAGDRIGVYFIGTNNAETHKAMGWVVDEVFLRIKRGDKTMEFMIDSYCGPDNTARMVRS